MTMTTHTPAAGAPFPVRLLSYLISVLLITQPVLPAYAANVSVAGGNTHMDKAGNGVPVMNIATPNQAGISHNTFNDFNVGKEGLILNNATDRLTQTQLGGLIQNNTNLKAGQEARGIINEVIGNKRSQLQGYMEVGGKAASVMVANPYGITCDGCGFINTPHATLTTGKPVLGADGSLQALEASRGTITIAGQGLDAGSADAVQLIARATEINAGIHAKDLTVIAGSNRVDKDGNVTALAPAGEAPKIAIDTGALGGMYANRIRLVSSETGLGVNLSDVNARQGDIILDVNGDLRMKHSLAAGQLKVNAGNLALSGSHRAEQGMQLTGRGSTAVNDALLSTGGDLALNGNGQLTVNNSRLQAGADARGKLSGGGRLSAQGARQQWSNSQVEAGNVTLSAAQSLTQDGASQVSAQTDLTVQGGALTMNGKNGAGRDVVVSGRTLSAGNQLTAQRDIRAQLSGDATLSGKLNAGQDVTLSAANVTSSGELTANRYGSVTAGTLDNRGLLQARGAQTITAANVANRDRIQAGGQLAMTADTVTNAGLIGGQGGLSLSVTDLLNVESGGELFSGAGLAVNAGRFLLAGVASAQGDMRLESGVLTTGAQSQWLAGGDMRLSATTASLGGLLASDGLMTLNASSLTSTAGAQTQAQRGLSLDIAGHGELNGVFTTLGDLTLSAGSLTHRAQSAGANVAVTAGNMTHGGLLQADGPLTLKADTLSVTQSGALLAKGQAQLDVQALDNDGTVAAQRLNITAAQRLANQRGAILNAAGDMTLATAQIANAGKLAAGNDLTLDAASLANHGLMQAGNNLSLTLSERLDNQAQGLLLAAGQLALKTPDLTNAGTLQGATAAVEVGALSNSGMLMGIDGL
ncbi:filamentous hemagglutinin N-terminal domain-containing protein, partial [Enterobacillus tribolii]